MDFRSAAKALGWFSLGLGLTELLAPRWLGRLTGVGERTRLMRGLGLRELAAGAGIFAQPKPAASMWARVAGDAMDAAVLTARLKPRRSRDRALASLGAVLGVGVLDAWVASQLPRA